MQWNGKLERIDEYRWEIPQGTVEGMLTNAIIFASEGMIPSIMQDNAPQQAANVACLPGIVGSSLAMPDIHWGYGFPIGGVAAMDLQEGVISPGGIGFDINCGVRLIGSSLREEDVRPKLKELVDALYRSIPSGLGSKGVTRLAEAEIDEVLRLGSLWAVEKGFGWDSDLPATEENGRMMEADPVKVSDKARKRGIPQLGSLGSGNHFLEIDRVEKVYDEKAATAFGLVEGGITISVHCGSRGCGHQIATDYLQSMERGMKKQGFQLPDRQLACARIDSPEGEDYFQAMSCGANYAWANRQMITHWVRESFQDAFNTDADELGMRLIYDVAHNIAKKETHTLEGSRRAVLVHRKGATRAFAPGSPELPDIYRSVGQPVIVPGDMGTGTYVLKGMSGSMRDSFGSSCHGAGRLMSRQRAISSFDASTIQREMQDKNIHLRSGSTEGLLEEAPGAYKDLESVVDVVCGAGLTGKVARLTPVAVIKG